MGNGTHTLFWLDRWVVECALHNTFPHLFLIADNPKVTVAKVFLNGIINLIFHRQLAGIYLYEWKELQKKFANLVLDNSKQDQLIWRWASNGIFTVHSLYTWLDYGGSQILPILQFGKPKFLSK